MRIGARDQPRGTVVDVVKGATTSQVKIDIGGAVVTAFVANDCPRGSPAGPRSGIGLNRCS